MAKRRTLNKERVVAAAARLANERGSTAALSLKDLAAELDIRVPSLYNHIRGVNGLQRDLTMFGLETLLVRLRQTGFGLTGRAAIIALAHEIRRFALDQPAVYPLIIQAPDPADPDHVRLGQEIIQIFQLILGSLGLAGDEALHAIRGLRALTHGFVTIELAGGFQLELNTDESFEKAVDTFLKGILAA